MPQIPVYVNKILSKLEASGFSAYIVGGCVRDTLLEKRPHDWDIASSASCEDVMRIFKKTVPTGLKYGTITVFVSGGHAEVTSFRADGIYRDGRRPENVEFVSDIKEDLKRRDFTMNAMAMTKDGELIDPFGGMEDIKNRIIRCVGNPDERFSEDALRMFRAVRFSAVTGFEIHEDTKNAIKKNAWRAEAVSSERIQTELSKVLMSPRPELIKQMADMGLLRKFLSGDISDSITNISELPGKNDFRWCAFYSKLKKCGAVDDTDRFLKALRLDSKTVRECAEVSKLSLPQSESDIRVFIAHHGERIALLTAAADGMKSLNRVRRIIKKGNYVPVNKLSITGDDLKTLGFSGKKIGETLLALSEEATLGIIQNEKAELLKSVKNKMPT